MRNRITYANVTATLALIAATAGGAHAFGADDGPTARVAAIPDAAGVYRACVRRSTGTLRLVNSVARCRRTGRVRLREFAVSWSQTGPAGRDGRAGTAGPPGSPGQPGAPGATKVTVKSDVSRDVSCPQGQVAVGGGATPDGAAITDSHPTPTSGTPTGWHSDQGAKNPGPQFNPTTYVICASP